MLYFVCIAKRKIFKLCFFLHAIILRVSSKIYNLVYFITFFCSHEIHIILPGLFYNTRTEFIIANRHFDDDDHVNNFVKICTSYMLLVWNFSSYKCLKINTVTIFLPFVSYWSFRLKQTGFNAVQDSSLKFTNLKRTPFFLFNHFI